MIEGWIIQTITNGASLTKCMELLRFYFEEKVRARGKITNWLYIESESIDIISKIARGEQVTPAYLSRRAKRLSQNMSENGYLDPEPLEFAVELDTASPTLELETPVAPEPRPRRKPRGPSAKTRAKYAELLRQKEIKAGCLTPPKPPTQPSLW